MAGDASIANLTKAVRDLDNNVKQLRLVLAALNENFVALLRDFKENSSEE